MYTGNVHVNFQVQCSRILKVSCCLFQKLYIPFMNVSYSTGRKFAGHNWWFRSIV